jgi:MFS family permease
MAVLLSTVIGVNVGYMAVLPLLPQLADALQLNSSDFAIFVASFAVAKILAQPLGGRATDAWGPRVPTVAGLVTAAVGILTIVQADGAAAAICGRLIWGAGDGIVTPALYRAVTVVSAMYGRDPARGYARLGITAVLSFALGPFAVAVVHPLADYRAILTVSGGLALISASLAGVLLPGRNPAGRESAAPTDDLRGIRPVLAVTLFGGIDLCANLLWGAMEPLVPLTLAQTLAHSAERSGLLLSLGMAVFVVSSPILARLPERSREPRLASAGLVLLGLSCIGLVELDVPLVGLPAITVFMAAQAYLYLVAREGIQRHCGATGRAWGYFGMFSDTGFMVGPPIGVFLFQISGPTAFSVLGAGTLLVAVVLTVAMRGRWTRVAAESMTMVAEWGKR